jgi:predicted esterase
MGGTTYKPPGSGGVSPFGNGGTTPFGNGGTTPFGNGGTTPFGNGGTTPVGGGGTPPSNGGTTAVADGMPVLPMAPANCPTLTNGGVAQFPRANGQNVPVTIYIDPGAKSKPDPGGPLIIYWHATLSNPGEVLSGFTQPNITAVTQAGGVVAAPATTACTGCTTTDDGYWFVEDDVVLDEIVACAVKQAKIDVTHIHTLGWSAGGLHTTHVAQARSNYIASFISYSGGLFLLPSMDQNPANKVAGILTYGDPGADVVILDFNAQSQSWYKQFQPMGWYSMMCHHPGGHEVDPQIAPLSLKFFKDHPFEVKPEPYAMAIPAGYPSYCSNMVH